MTLSDNQHINYDYCFQNHFSSYYSFASCYSAVK